MMTILRCRLYLNAVSLWHSLRRERWRRTLIYSTAEIVALLFLHFVLLRIMAAGNLASMIFTGGGQAPVWAQLAVGLFMVVRLLVTLGLPGMLLARAGLVWIDFLERSRK